MLEVFILIFIIIISMYRSPFIFIEGRFIGEEATHYFLYALNNNFIENLFYYDTFSGYYNLTANLLAEIATYLPLEFAPYATVYGSFLIILNLYIFSLFYNSLLFTNTFIKIIGTFILFLSPPMISEIWLNSLNSQIYLCLTTILILFLNEKKKFNYLHSYLTLFLASLSGIYSCTLTPLFLIKYIYNRNKFNFINLIILSFGTLTQIILILFSKYKNYLLDTKFELLIDFQLIQLFTYNILIKPVFGRQFTHYIYENFLSFFLSEKNLIVLIFILITICLFVVLKKFKFFVKDYVLLALIYIFFSISFLIIIGSVDTHVGGRYAVIPGITLLLIILKTTTMLNRLYLKFFSILLILSSLMSGLYEFRPPTKNVKHQYIKFLDCIECPVWRNEVSKWKKDNSYIIGIWPYPSKRFKLILN